MTTVRFHFSTQDPPLHVSNLLCLYLQCHNWFFAEVEIHPPPLQPLHGGVGLYGVWGGFCPHCSLYIWKGLDRNVQPHECQLSEARVRSRLLWLCRRGQWRQRRSRWGDRRRGKWAGRDGLAWTSVKDREQWGQSMKMEEKDAWCSTPARLSCPFLNHHLLLFKHILSFNA